jgi:hypothetical protein
MPSGLTFKQGKRTFRNPLVARLLVLAIVTPEGHAWEPMIATAARR